MRDYFHEIIRLINNNLRNDELFTAWFSAEELDYCRFNKGKIRQAGTVEQQYLSLDLIAHQKHTTTLLGLKKNLALDQDNIKKALQVMREQLTMSQIDPYHMMNEQVMSSENIISSQLEDRHSILNFILENVQGLDFVGSFVAGPIYRGFANSFGQINWFNKSSFILDSSIYHSQDKAIKINYSDIKFDRHVLNKKIAEAREDLAIYNKTPKIIEPGHYRVYFSPSAVHEIFSMINWGGFSHKSLRVKNSPLLALYNKDKSLSPKLSLYENIKAGVGPSFQSQGFLKPAQLNIIEEGQLKNTLISPKTAKEYSNDHNGADESENMSSMDMADGDLKENDILKTLDNGLFINNLWYLNFSDRQNGCITGMTRFLCHTVKNGLKDAPFNVMRFDDSIYNIFGDNLKHITKNREMIIDNDTYDERSTSCAILPGIIAEKVRFTL